MAAVQEVCYPLRTSRTHIVYDMRYRAYLRKITIKAYGNTPHDTQRTPEPFIFLAVLLHVSRQQITDKLQEKALIPHHSRGYGIGAVCTLHIHKRNIIELIGVFVLFHQIVRRACQVKVLVIIDKTCKAALYELLQQRFAD